MCSSWDRSPTLHQSLMMIICFCSPNMSNSSNSVVNTFTAGFVSRSVVVII